MKWIADHKMGIWAFVVAVAFIPHIMSSAFLPRWAAIVIGAPLVSRLTLERLSQGMQYVLVLGISWAACSVLVSPNPMHGALELFFIVAMVGAFVAASEIDSLDDAMTGLALGIAVSSVLCLLFLVGIRPVEQNISNLELPAGLFYNSEVLAEFTAPVFLWAVLRKRWPLVLMTAVPMVACGSRVALLAAGAGLVYALWRRSRLWGSVVAFGWVIAGAALVLFVPGRLSGSGQRVVVWLATLLAATPLGNGLGWFEAAHPIEQFAHSDAIQAINELGIGALFLAAIPFLIMRSNRGSNAERAVFVAICVEVAVSFPLHVPGAAFVAAIVAGYLAGDRSLVFLRRPDGRARNAQDARWYSENRGANYGVGELGRRAVPVRSESHSHAALGYA